MFKAESHKKSFMRKGNPDDLCFIYVTRMIDGSFKFGACGTSLPKKQSYYKNPLHIVFKSDRVQVSELEYILNVHFGSEHFTELREFFVELRKGIESIVGS